MEQPTEPIASLSDAEIAQLRSALSMRFASATGVLGSQLGTAIAEQLPRISLRNQFGGLKRFSARFFPTEIVWSGKKELDDLYDIRFGDSPSDTLREWNQVPLTATPALWAAVTNPSIYLQFAWSRDENALFRATEGIPLRQGFTVVEKLRKLDYEEIAKAFLESGDLPPGLRDAAIPVVADFQAFANVIRGHGMLPRWEAFRVEHALRRFTDRLEGAGAGTDSVSRWVEILKLSQQQAWSARMRRTTLPKVSQSATPGRRFGTERSYPSPARRIGLIEARAIAVSAIEYLSESEIAGLRLPLGEVIRALEAHMKSH